MTEEKQQERMPTGRPAPATKTKSRSESPAVAGAARKTEDSGSVSPGSTDSNEETPAVAVATPAGRPAPSAPPPDPELSDRPVRRKFDAAYKLRILQEADRCRDTQGIGSLLRREGLYSSHLGTWRQQRQEGSLSALAPRKRGRPAEKPHPDTLRLAQVEREKRHLERRLKQAEALLELQKKVSEILGIDLPPAPIDEGK